MIILSEKITKEEQNKTDTKWIYEVKQRAAERAHDNHYSFIEILNRATIDSGNLALRSALLINGGAAIAILAYIGTLKIDHAAEVIDSMIWFATGVFLAAVGLGLGFLTNYFHSSSEACQDLEWEHPYVISNEKSRLLKRLSYRLLIGATLAGLFSLAFFLTGMIDVKNTISSIPSH